MLKIYARVSLESTENAGSRESRQNLRFKQCSLAENEEGKKCLAQSARSEGPAVRRPGR